ncbi:MAG: D-alanyl-D-alanine carboxypeptidase/D-alanyl-D-alanine-endopeptidase [Prevotellaceae bacterium]|jgi:D-alanyl-D-alanine carboxypeptidase/D-alanyl-D-alanine-endopeptidase (penicillin-binding protein 4)|nr:D-alanyl-D-alanine carboxypeptidase/D-alanyl-D-alanine-endopeptidase [Prevotellaceae bacterium]
MNKIRLLVLLIFIAYQPVSAQKSKNIGKTKIKEFAEYVNSLEKHDSDLQNAVWSVAVADAKSGEFLFEYNSQYSVLPASNMKIVTTGVGLLLLGADYSFKTELEYTGNIIDSVLVGDIYVTGGGDPSLGSHIYQNTVPDSVFLKWSQAVKNLGIKRIAGRIIADTRFFDDENRPGSWEFDDIGTDYGAGISGIQFMDNVCKLYIESASTTAKQPNIIRIEPYIPEISWENYLTSTDSINATGVSLYSSPYSSRALLFGKILTNSHSKTITAAIPNPAYTCVWYFNKYLNQNGISTSNRIEVLDRKTPDLDRKTKQVFYTHNSPAYTEIINETNKSSNNSFAETIIKTIGAELVGDGTLNEGRKLIAQKLKDLNVITDGFQQSDGSGLSRHNYVTTKFLCEYLSTMYNSSEYEHFVQSLPIAGIDGTMKNMLKKTAAEGNVKAKSGSLSGVRSYSGYVTTKKGKDLCFSFVFNNFTCKSAVITQKIEKLMILLAEEE